MLWNEKNTTVVAIKHLLFQLLRPNMDDRYTWSWFLFLVLINISQISGPHPLWWHRWILCDRRRQVYIRNPWIFWACQILSSRKWRGKVFFMFVSRISLLCCLKYVVNPTSQVRNPESTLHELDKTHQECQEIKMVTRAFLEQVTESHRPSIINEGKMLFWQVLWRNVASILLGSCLNRALNRSFTQFLMGFCFFFFQVSVWLHT